MDGQESTSLLTVAETAERLAVGFSIGYLAESKAQHGGGRRITEVDLFKISVTSKPMHPSTRTLGWKSQPPLQIVSFECRALAYSRSSAASRAGSPQLYPLVHRVPWAWKPHGAAPKS